MKQVRRCAVWPTENWRGSSINHIQVWMIVWESYCYALEKGCLLTSHACPPLPWDQENLRRWMTYENRILTCVVCTPSLTTEATPTVRENRLTKLDHILQQAVLNVYQENGHFGADMKSLDRWSITFREFFLPCMWLLSSSSQFSYACTVKRQTKAG